MTQLTDKQRLKIFRDSLGMDQVKFAEAIFMSQGGYSDAEGEKTKTVSKSILKKIESKWGKEVSEWIARGKGEVPPKVIEHRRELSYADVWKMYEKSESEKQDYKDIVRDLRADLAVFRSLVKKHYPV